MNFILERDPESGSILVFVRMDNRHLLRMILDTGASISTIDSNALYMAGYDLKNAIGIQDIETASGVIETEVFEIQKLVGLGITKTDFPVIVYDFLAHGIFSNYQGLLGMDFFEGAKFCIDTVENILSIEPKTVR
jgi:predicted aspartyl protease